MIELLEPFYIKNIFVLLFSLKNTFRVLAITFDGLKHPIGYVKYFV